MHGAGDLFPKRGPKIFDLFMRDRSSFSFTSNETKDAWRPQNPQAFLGCLYDPNERVTTEHRHFHFASPVAPPMDLFE
jgi:hypothetical protein